MDGISRSRGWDKKIPHGGLHLEQLALSDKWARKIFLSQPHTHNGFYFLLTIINRIVIFIKRLPEVP